MPKYCLVQISDIHARVTDAGLIDRFAKAAGAVGLIADRHVQCLVVLLTGDLAFSGKAEEYSILQPCLDAFASTAKAKGLSCEFLIVPGNHDCDLKHPAAAVREVLIRQATELYNATPDRSVIASFLKVQEGCFNFCDNNGVTLSRDHLVTIFTLENIRIRAYCINTAWASEQRDTDSRPFILSELSGLERLPEYLNVTLFHHPRSWLSKAISGQFMRRVEDASDFIFTGHEHDSASYDKSYTGGRSQTYYEAGAFADSSGSRFRAIIVNTDTKEFTLTDFTWNDQSSLYESQTFADLVFPLTPQSNAAGLILSPAFEKRLRDPEMPLQHPMKRELNLSDFYVFPRLVALSSILTEDTIPTVIADPKTLYATLRDRTLCVVLGQDRAGKTALCKTVASFAFSSGDFPILLDGEQLISDSDVVIRNLLNAALAQQYRNSLTIDAFQDPTLHPVIIVDRFDQIPLSPAKVASVIDKLRRLASALLLSEDWVGEIQSLGDPRLGIPLDEVVRLQIAPMTATQRRQLIDKWLIIGASDDDGVADARAHQLDLYIGALFSEFGIPALPLFVLTYLQVAVSASSEPNLNLSSNAKLLETLVNLSLLRVPDAKVSAETATAYLRELAYYMHVQGLKLLTERQAKVFHGEYCTKLDVSLAVSDMWRELTYANILRQRDEGWGFKYSYFRTFFVAAYLRVHLTASHAQQAIQQLIADIQVAENASILATLSLYSAETWVLTELQAKLDQALGAFGETSIAELGDAADRVGSLASLPLHDDHEAQEREVGPGETTPSDPTREALEMAQAIRLIHVLGQLIRNSLNVVEGHLKRQLVESVFRAAARIAGLQRKLLDEGRDEFLGYIYKRLRSRTPQLSDADARGQAKARLSVLAAGCAIGLVDLVSHAVGDEFLDPTFQRISADDGAKRYEHYLFGIRLDWYRRYPKDDVLRLNSEARAGFRRFIIRYLGFRSLAFRGNDLSTPVVQELCAKLEVDFRRLQLRAASGTFLPKVN